MRVTNKGLNFYRILLGVLVTLIFFQVDSFAAVPSKIHLLQGNGAQMGGVAGAGFTLMDLRLSHDSKRKVERIVMDIGDKNGQIIRGLPGYFQVELKDNPQRLIVNLSQMPNSKINSQQLASIFQKSLAVKKTALALDPVDSTLILSMDLKKNTKVRVLQVAGKKQTSKVVLDLITE